MDQVSLNQRAEEIELAYLREKFGGKQCTCEAARHEAERKGPNAYNLAYREDFGVFDFVKSYKSWKTKPLPSEDAIQAAIALRTLAGRCIGILSRKGEWALKVKASDFVETLSDQIALCFAALDKNERIESLTAIVGRIAKLHASEKVVLTTAQLDAFELALILAVKASGSSEGRADLSALGKQFADLVSADFDVGSWNPSDKWRETDPKETAAAYFERVIAPLPYHLRPSTTHLATAQPELYRSLKYLCYDQKRFNRTGSGEIGQARALSDILPIGAQRPKPPRGKTDPK